MMTFSQNGQGYLFVGFKFLLNFWFLNHNFSSRYASKPIKPSKDLDDSLDFEKT